MFFDKKWCQIWLCPVKQCLIWFKFHCLSRIMAVSRETWFFFFFFFFFCFFFFKFFFFFFFFFFFLWHIFWHYYRKSFKLKEFIDFRIHWNILMKLLYLKGYRWLLSQNQQVRIYFFGYRQYEALTKHMKLF